MESPAERIEVAAKFLLQSPPGEINDVLNGKCDLTANASCSTPFLIQMSETSSQTTSHFKMASYPLYRSITWPNSSLRTCPEVNTRYDNVARPSLFAILISISTFLKVIISEAGRLQDGEEGEVRFLDPRSKTSFAFDHLRLVSLHPGITLIRGQILRFRKPQILVSTKPMRNRSLTGKDCLCLCVYLANFYLLLD